MSTIIMTSPLFSLSLFIFALVVIIVGAGYVIVSTSVIVNYDYAIVVNATSDLHTACSKETAG